MSAPPASVSTYAYTPLFDWFPSYPSLIKVVFSKYLQLCYSIRQSSPFFLPRHLQSISILSQSLSLMCAKINAFSDSSENTKTASPVKNAESRFKIGNIPTRTFHYLPLGPRLGRNYDTISCLLRKTGNGKMEERRTAACMPLPVGLFVYLLMFSLEGEGQNIASRTESHHMRRTSSKIVPVH